MMRGKALAATLLFTLPALAQHGSTPAVNPYTSRENAEAGGKLYRAQCAGCHGIDGAGAGAGPTLTSGMFRHGGSDEDLFRAISKGLSGTAMPSFAFSGQQVWELVTHVRALGLARGVTSSKGDPQAGAAVFRANCSGCHAVAGEGGLNGPDLTGVGGRRSSAELLHSITQPDADVAAEYWSVIAKTAGGETVRGVRLNEDTASVQLRDTQGRLRSLRKQDLTSLELVRRSPMPSFQGKLSEARIADVVAWLMSQKGGQ
jgi:putative heme-binding domain-containing protein